MKRRNFIGLCVAGSTALLADAACTQKQTTYKGKITGASAKIGHILRDYNGGAPPTSYESIDTVIVGGGVSGLSAGRWLDKGGKQNFVVLELENHAGGNASYGKNETSAYPCGAHYIPTPNNHLTEYIDFLKNADVVTGFENNLPIYNEEFLCYDQQERLFINGAWQDGLIPERGVTADEKQQIKKFLDLMDHYRNLKDERGKFAFDIPVDKSSTTEEFTKLDNITMKEWMDEQQLNTEPVQWYVNYCTRDDFGCNYDSVSAWVGIHYFAARKGKGTNAEHGDTLTWPQGNGFLVDQLKKSFVEKIQANSLALSIFPKGEKVAIHYMDTATQQIKGLLTNYCIMATPLFVTARLLKNYQNAAIVKEKFIYTPWLVANLKLKQPSITTWQGMSWDNVIYNSKSLGYVDATHQLPDQLTKYKNITYYLPITDKDVTSARLQAYKNNHEDWCKIVLEDLKKAHPDIENYIEEINITVWGHSMPKPLPGHVFEGYRKQLQEPIDQKIFFAHTDFAGISIFEEGFYQGINAAEQIVNAG